MSSFISPINRYVLIGIFSRYVPVSGLFFYFRSILPGYFGLGFCNYYSYSECVAITLCLTHSAYICMLKREWRVNHWSGFEQNMEVKIFTIDTFRRKWAIHDCQVRIRGRSRSLGLRTFPNGPRISGQNVRMQDFSLIVRHSQRDTTTADKAQLLEFRS